MKNGLAMNGTICAWYVSSQPSSVIISSRGMASASNGMMMSATTAASTTLRPVQRSRASA